ncbi:MAG: prepilin-type N-terminal cleavage/methylation domain-containing protein [candidate division Zixibacteria bacterium]|nr:prepilin-type N-terminal cleavage/methylation domain-containing protein [candidate division Zixibacteria bacterium]
MRKIIGNRRGFTLTELMIAVVIIGVLAVLAIGRFSAVATSAKQAEVKGILKQIYVLERAYLQEYEGYWPSDGSTITADSSLANRDNFNMLSLSVEIMATARYSYALTGNPTTFTVVATATGLDDDATQDIWQIDQTGSLVCLSDDVRN